MITEDELMRIIKQNEKRFEEITDLVESSLIGQKGLYDMDWRNLLGCYKIIADNMAIVRLFNQYFQNEDIQKNEKIMDEAIRHYEDQWLSLLNQLGVVKR